MFYCSLEEVRPVRGDKDKVWVISLPPSLAVKSWGVFSIIEEV